MLPSEPVHTSCKALRSRPRQDEMAAILRFGAEQLFKEDDQAAVESSKQMLEEDIDAILGRAEVVDAGDAGKNEVPGGSPKNHFLLPWFLDAACIKRHHRCLA